MINEEFVTLALRRRLVGGIMASGSCQMFVPGRIFRGPWGTLRVEDGPGIEDDVRG